jgi:hypothetical protein
MNIMLLVGGSAPVRTIITRPMGNRRPPAMRIRPGAWVWYQGAVLVERRTAQLGRGLVSFEKEGRKEITRIPGEVLPLRS